MFTENSFYQEDLHNVSQTKLPWETLKNKTLLITGASGLIGSFLIDVLMLKNKEENLNVKVYALGRNEKIAKERFNAYWDLTSFNFLQGDVNVPLENKFSVDYIIHAASNAHPRLYSSDPINSIITNITGTYNLLQYAVENKTSRVVFMSSVEIYGEALEETDNFDESYCGYIDCNTLRAGYPEGKRAGEALCNAFIKQYNLDIVIPRLSRTYGPTMRLDDSKAMSQFIMNGVREENITLKSEGNQLYSYCYVADAVLGILYVLFLGKTGEAYNVADPKDNLNLRELAKYIADVSGTKVVFDLPDKVEQAGFSKVQRGVLDSTKLVKLGWDPFDNLKTGIKKTIRILKE